MVVVHWCVKRRWGVGDGVSTKVQELIVTEGDGVVHGHGGGGRGISVVIAAAVLMMASHGRWHARGG